ncbi:hypothetical protein BT63DRAFT_409451 [Microthyrium microscopicum]|uniref:Uncharacterized protein n=1 Tax=Microthyrium microscopicum TaxID=703497 RepID=A0A6A6UVB8_9PEZI|nr:hypothetical protein BT63DRAFT_409451 [Microthyrium microscopicum]
MKASSIVVLSILGQAIAAPALVDRRLNAALVDNLRAMGLTEKAILVSLNAEHPTPSLPFRVIDEEDDVSPQADFFINGSASARNHRDQGIWAALLRVMGFGDELDGYEGMKLSTDHQNGDSDGVKPAKDYRQRLKSGEDDDGSG